VRKNKQNQATAAVTGGGRKILFFPTSLPLFYSALLSILISLPVMIKKCLLTGIMSGCVNEN
jgi:hypothetical protein